MVKQKQIIKFLKTHKNPNDRSVHNFAFKHHLKTDKVEEAIYRIASKHVRQGKK